MNNFLLRTLNDKWEAHEDLQTGRFLVGNIFTDRILPWFHEKFAPSQDWAFPLAFALRQRHPVVMKSRPCRGLMGHVGSSGWVGLALGHRCLTGEGSRLASPPCTQVQGSPRSSADRQKLRSHPELLPRQNLHFNKTSRQPGCPWSLRESGAQSLYTARCRGSKCITRGSVDWVLAWEPKGHWFNSQSRAHVWVAGRVPSRGHTRGNHTLMFLSFSLPSPL